MRRSRRIELPLALLLALFMAWLLFDRHTYARLSPSYFGNTFTGLLQHLDPPKRLATLHIDGASFLYVTGQLPSYWLVPSGEPCYIFNSNGTLVDWTSDSGDDPAFVARWGGPYENTELDPSTARQQFAAQ